ncbi:MAG TPA: hypothetical protein VH985_14950 [Candidatus Binatia bacterium]
MGVTLALVLGRRQRNDDLLSDIGSGKLRQLILIGNIEEKIEKTFLCQENGHPVGIDRVSKGDDGWRIGNSLCKFSIDFVPRTVMDEKLGLPVRLLQHWNQIENVLENPR